MTDDIKLYLTAMRWPEPHPHLAMRVMDEIIPVFGWILGSRTARYAFAAGISACLLAGYFIGPIFMPLETGLSFYSGSQNLLYHFSL